MENIVQMDENLVIPKQENGGTARLCLFL